MQPIAKLRVDVSATDWSWDRESGLGESAVWPWSFPAGAHSGRAADAAHDTPRLLPALAANHHRKVLSLRRGSYGRSLNFHY